jgi:hypothetical protein
VRAHVLGIDRHRPGHDLAAAADYGRLGFTIAARHPQRTGTGNHTIMLERDYFELMGAVARPSQPAARDLARREGMAGSPGGPAAAGAAAECARHRRRRSVFLPPVQMPGGGFSQAAFDTTQFPPRRRPHVLLPAPDAAHGLGAVAAAPPSNARPAE